jgi:hypothetical protein
MLYGKSYESITDNDFVGDFISGVLASGDISTGAVAGNLASVNSFSMCINCDGCLLVIDQEHPFSSGTRVGLPDGFVKNFY